MLFNLFRGTGPKGVAGINDFNSLIIRPLSKTPKADIDEYVKTQAIPYCIDQTNFDENYTRNYIRLSVLPVIEKVFPEAQKSIVRFSQTIKEESEFLDELALKEIVKEQDVYKLKSDLAPVLFKRATVQILKLLGKTCDYEKVHVDTAHQLTTKQNGSKIDLGENIVVSKEYEWIVFALTTKKSEQIIPLTLPTTEFLSAKFTLLDTPPKNLKDGLYIDADKLPKNTVIRTKRDGDTFTKFGGGTKKLCDYLTDKKIPSRERENLVLLASENQVFAISGVAVSELVKVEENTKNIMQIK